MIISPELDAGHWRTAAVLIPIYEEAGEEYVILTRRTHEVEHHKGQIAFPGGAQDPSDECLWDTALRETEEEIGLRRDSIKLLKELKPQITPTGFHVTPFVGRIEVPDQWQISDKEIAELFSVPLKHLRDPKNLELKTIEYDGKEYPDPHFTYREHIIWGMTGRVLYEFLELTARV